MFDLNARVQHLSELLNTVMMYEPGERKRELCCWKRQTLARERVDTPLEQGPRDLLLQEGLERGGTARHRGSGWAS